MIKKINWGTAIVIFFAIFLTLAAVFISFAMRQNNDLVADDYYEQGAHFSLSIEIKKRSFPFKDSIGISVVDPKIQLEIASCIAQKADSFKVQFYCGSNKKNDFAYAVAAITDCQKTSKSVLTFPLAKFKKSYYSVKVAWWIDSLRYEIDKDLVVK